jgi:hypothetical protein
MRISVAIPQTVAAALRDPSATRIDLPNVANGGVKPVAAQLVPAIDASTHTQELRLDLPANLAVRPGTFARVWVGTSVPTDTRLWVPGSAVVRRGEVTAVYVVAGDARPLLRQVRLGPAAGVRIEVLSGLSAGERVVLDPQAAARALRGPPCNRPSASRAASRRTSSPRRSRRCLRWSRCSWARSR